VHTKCLSLRRAVVICTPILCKGPFFTCAVAERAKISSRHPGNSSGRRQVRLNAQEPHTIYVAPTAGRPVSLALRLAFTPSRMLSTTVVVHLRLNADPLVLPPANVRHCTLSSRPVCSFVVRWRSRGSSVRSRNTYASDRYGCSFVVPSRSRRAAVCSRNTYGSGRCGLLKDELQMSRLITAEASVIVLHSGGTRDLSQTQLRVSMVDQTLTQEHGRGGGGSI